ncbi:hypothetical protein MPTK1_2g10680 [Marchantia polymorpha subsp. ruderalis]
MSILRSWTFYNFHCRVMVRMYSSCTPTRNHGRSQQYNSEMIERQFGLRILQLIAMIKSP